mmetsp:Transcript_17404/g.49670  ORF Transcript_17404/g.49670 Transcript_17404/m.49670 type:complete len:252 (-) Transcript_17404:4657-5412(-)
MASNKASTRASFRRSSPPLTRKFNLRASVACTDNFLGTCFDGKMSKDGSKPATTPPGTSNNDRAPSKSRSQPEYLSRGHVGLTDFFGCFARSCLRPSKPFASFVWSSVENKASAFFLKDLTNASRTNASFLEPMPVPTRGHSSPSVVFLSLDQAARALTKSPFRAALRATSKPSARRFSGSCSPSHASTNASAISSLQASRAALMSVASVNFSEAKRSASLTDDGEERAKRSTTGLTASQIALALASFESP